MKRKLLLSSTVASALLASGAMAQVVNFHDGNNGQPLNPTIIQANYYMELFAGQGAYADPGNNIWNGFGVYEYLFTSDSYQSTITYSGSPGPNGPWPQQIGNPGNPYAAYLNTGDQWVSSTGPKLFDFSTGSPTVSGNADSSGKWTPITLAMNYYLTGDSSDYGGAGGIPNGTPAFLLASTAYCENYSLPSSSPDQHPEVGMDLQNVPGGANTYGLYLYGANWNNSRGTSFAVSSGNAHNGIAATLNDTLTSPAASFGEGVNFVIFENVTPDANGNIHISAFPNPQDGVGNFNLADEADFCGVQLIFNPPPTAVASTAAQNVLAGGTASFSFSPAFASGASFRWQSVIGGVTNKLSDGGNISGSGTTNLTIANVGAGNVGLYQCVIATGTRTNSSPLAPLTLLPYTGGNILQRGDALVDVNNNPPSAPPYNSVPPTFYMSVTNVEDGSLNQYVNYGFNGDTNPFEGPVGFVVTPQIGSTVVRGLRLFTSGSHPEDDPADYLLQGSTDGGVTFTTISSGPLALPAQRNAAGGPINVANQVLQEVDFANTTSYTTYQLTFSNVNNNATASNGVQIAEVQLLAPAPIIVQEPTAANNILVGGTLNARVVVSGANPISYQWYSNATQIAGATSAAFTLANLQASAGGGSYTCVVSNAYGTVTTKPSSLTVVTPTPYQATVLADKPLAYWPLNETSGTTAYDIVGGHNGTYSNAPVLNQAGPSSALPTSALFDGTTNYVLIPDTPALDFGGPITLEAWILPTTEPSGLANILGHGYDANENSAELVVRLQSSANGLPFYGGYFNNNQFSTGVQGGVTQPSTWTHVVLTWDGANWNVYLNGIVAGRSPSSIGPIAFSDPWAIADGTATGNTRYFAGNICGAAIYNHALTPAQVAAHYTAAGQPPIITAPPQDSVVMVNSNVTMSVAAIGTPPLTYQWYNGTPNASTLIAGATASTLPFVNAQSTAAGSYYVVVTENSGLAATNNSPGALLTVVTSPLPGNYFASVVSLNPQAYWPLTETNQPTPYGALNLGTLGEAGDGFWGGTNLVYQELGALADTNPSDTNYAIATDGVSAYVVLPYNVALSNPPPFTVEAWLQSANIDATECAMSCMDPGEAGNRAGWLIYMDITGSGLYTFRTYNKNGLAASISLDATTAVTAYSWHHVVAVVNTNGNPTPDANGVYPAGSITASLYLDGQLSATSSPAGYGINDSLGGYGGFTIGTRSDFGFSFAGEEDEVAYYTYALSSNTIFAHYAAGTNVAPVPPYYQLVKESSPLLFYQLDESGTYPYEGVEPLARNYGATGPGDNGYYLPGTRPAAVPGPNVAGFPGTGANNVAVSFNHNYWGAGSPSGNGNPGQTGFVDVPYNTGDLNILSPVTMAAWIQAAPTEGRTGWECFFGRGDSSLRLQIDDTAERVQFGDSGLYVNGTGAAANINDGLWHFLVGSWDGQTMSIYVDGILNGTNTGVGIPGGNTTQDLTIGESPDNEPNRVFDGNMAQVALFGYALSAAQVQSLYNSADVLPYITQQPPASLGEPVGATVTLSVAAGGTPTLAYEWLKGTAPVSGAEFSGATTATLTITGAAAGDTGNYSVVVTNNYGAVTSSVTALSVVGGAPVVQIDIAPLLVEVATGEPVTFSVTVVGTEPFHYQWMQDSIAVAGATGSSYTFNALAGSNTYSVSISNAIGSTSSSTAAVVSYPGYPNSTNPPPVITFNNNGDNWTLNQGNAWPGGYNNPSIVSNVLTLTDGTNGETCSAFFNTPQYVGGFVTSFIFMEANGNAPLADGATFCLQNAPDGPATLGGAGGGLGYTGIDPSAALELNIYSGDHGGAGIMFGTEGAVPDTDATLGNFLSTSPVNLASGDPIFVQMAYSKDVATVTLVDTKTAALFSTNLSIPNLPAIVGGGSEGTAYVGFTAATGGLNSVQTISNFVYSYTTTMTPTLAAAHGASPGSVVISWPVGVTPLFVLQQSATLSGPWSPAALPQQVVNGQNQVTLTPGAGNSSTFFKLSLQ